MDLSIVIGLIVLSLNECNSFQDHSSFAEEDIHGQFYLEDNENSNLTSRAEFASNPWQNNFSNNLTSEGIPIAIIPYDHVTEDEYYEEEINKDEMGDSANSNIQVLPKREDDTPQKILLQYLSKTDDKDFNNFEENNRQLIPAGTPTRREINIWRNPEDFREGDSIPWHYDVYYPRERYMENEFVDYPSGPKEMTDQRNLSVFSTSKTDREPPHYYQKNYYYNYYPFVRNRNHHSRLNKNGSQETRRVLNLQSSSRNIHSSPKIRKSACKQYLEFLKYAFEKLDESPEYEYDYSDDYNNDNYGWDEILPSKNHRVFSTHLLGPTVYVDNSGKISQMNSNGNSHQQVEGIPSISGVLKVSPIPLHEFKPKTTVPSVFSYSRSTTEVHTTPSANKLYDYNPSTPSWPRITSKINSTIMNMTKSVFRQDSQIDFKIEDPTFTRFPAENYSAAYGKKSEIPIRQEFEDSNYRTTVQIGSTEEPTNYDEYDYNEIQTTTSPVTTITPYWYKTHDYYHKFGNAMERNEEFSISNVISNSTSSIEFPSTWHRHSSPLTSTTMSIINPYGVLESNTGKKDDPDCNDRMLPCPDTYNITYPLNGYCNRFVSCESGRAIRRTCPEGLHFNIVTKSCDIPYNSFCTYACPKEDGYYGVPGDCGGYFICKNSMAEYRMCPARMHWDVEKRTCTFAELSSCPMKCSKINEVKEYKGDCKAYIICLQGIPYYHKCPPNSKFDRKVLTCISDKASDCQDDPRLLTKNLNPNHICRDIEVKVGGNTWCNFFLPPPKEELIP